MAMLGCYRTNKEYLHSTFDEISNQVASLAYLSSEDTPKGRRALRVFIFSVLQQLEGQLATAISNDDGSLNQGWLSICNQIEKVKEDAYKLCKEEEE